MTANTLIPSMDSEPPIPKQPGKRTAIVDAMRGWALLSVALVNFALFYSFDAVIRIPAEDVTSKTLKILVQLLFQAKGWTLLSLLFGYGFSALLASGSGKDRDATWLFRRRMFWLSLIAVVNSCFYYGDILKDYVLMGLAISLFSSWSRRNFLILAISCLLVFPALIPLSRVPHIEAVVPNPPLILYTSHHLSDVLWFGFLSGVHVLSSFRKYFDWNLVMLTCGFLGVYLQKSRFFERLSQDTRPLRRGVCISAGFVLLLPLLKLGCTRLGWPIDHYYDAYMWFELSLMVLISSSVCWTFLKLSSTAVFSLFQCVGRMTLTNYLVQNVITLLLFSGFGFGLLHRVSYSLCIVAAVTTFALQMWFSRWWLSNHVWGPTEWLWRSLTYGKKIPNDVK